MYWVSKSYSALPHFLCLVKTAPWHSLHSRGTGSSSGLSLIFIIHLVTSTQRLLGTTGQGHWKTSWHVKDTISVTRKALFRTFTLEIFLLSLLKEIVQSWKLQGHLKQPFKRGYFVHLPLAAEIQGSKPAFQLPARSTLVLRVFFPPGARAALPKCRRS